ncbi:MAG: hypothetical protein Q9M36_00915 [Sulfurovum sp.]|nr:hypothetical protein [Sulfurovum sp.]
MNTTLTQSEINAKMSVEKQAFLDKQPTNKGMEEIIIGHLKNIYDPELPVNIYDLGLVYK